MMNMFGARAHDWTNIGYISSLVKQVRLHMHALRAKPFDACAIDRTDNSITFYWRYEDAIPLADDATLLEIYQHNGTLTTSGSIDNFIADMARQPKALTMRLLSGLIQQGFPVGSLTQEYEPVMGETEHSFPVGVNTYENMAERVANTGVRRINRTGTDTFGVFSENMVFDLRDGFPLITTKKVHMKSILVELLWFLRGSDNTAWLKENGVSIWDEWAKEDGSLGPVYGVQWRNWKTSQSDAQGVDQIAELIEKLKTNPFDRRLIVSAWNVGQLSEMALPPCHAFFQFYVEEQDVKILHCKLYQRSADVFLGVPFNIASYALLMTIIARQVGMLPGRFHWTGGDVHIYENHARQLGTQLQRIPRPLPDLEISRVDIPEDVSQYEVSDFSIKHYLPHPALSGQVAV